MTLYEGVVKREYIVRGIHLAEWNTVRRLAALGLIELAHVKMLNKKRAGACIIQVRGTRFALGSHITKGIEVEEVPEHA